MKRWQSQLRKDPLHGGICSFAVPDSACGQRKASLGIRRRASTWGAATVASRICSVGHTATPCQEKKVSTRDETTMRGREVRSRNGHGQNGLGWPTGLTSARTPGRSPRTTMACIDSGSASRTRRTPGGFCTLGAAQKKSLEKVGKGVDNFTGLRPRIWQFISSALGFGMKTNPGCRIRDYGVSARDLEASWTVVDCPRCVEHEQYFLATPRPLVNKNEPPRYNRDDCPRRRR